MTPNYISRCLGVTESQLNQVTIEPLKGEHFDYLKPEIHAGFCFDNSLRVGVALDLESIVYGVAVITIGDNILPIEHCWCRDDSGRYYDPTYQTFDPKCFKTKPVYYSLIEIAIDDYLEIAFQERGELSRICALDFTALRHTKRFTEYFKRSAAA